MSAGRWQNSRLAAEAQREDSILGTLSGDALEQARKTATECLRIACNGATDTDLRLTAVEDMLALVRRNVSVRGLAAATPHIAQWLGVVAADPWQRPIDRIRAAQFLLAGAVLGWWAAPHFKLEHTDET